MPLRMGNRDNTRMYSTQTHCEKQKANLSFVPFQLRQSDLYGCRVVLFEMCFIHFSHELKNFSFNRMNRIEHQKRKAYKFIDGASRKMMTQNKTYLRPTSTTVTLKVRLSLLILLLLFLF